MTNLNPRPPNSSFRMAGHNQLPTKLARTQLQHSESVNYPGGYSKNLRDLAKMGREIHYFPFLVDEK